jgi:hypothetical protein
LNIAEGECDTRHHSALVSRVRLEYEGVINDAEDVKCEWVSLRASYMGVECVGLKGALMYRTGHACCVE